MSKVVSLIKFNNSIKNSDFILVILYSFLSHLYFTIRYSGRIAQGDTIAIIKSIQAIDVSNTIYAYPNGYGFQIVSAVLSEITNLTIQQILILPLGFLYAIIAYPLFFYLTKQKDIAILSTLLLTLQPYLLYSTATGSHERFTVYLILMSVFTFMLYFKHHKTPTDNFKYLLLFNISIFCVYANNSYFGTLITGIILGSIFLYIIYSRKIINGLLYFVPILLSLIITLIFYSFTVPKIGIFRLLPYIMGKIFNLNYSNYIFFAGVIILLIIYLLQNNNISAGIRNLIKSSYMIAKGSNKMLHFCIFFIGFCGYILALNKLSHSFDLFFKSPFIWLLLTSFNWIILPLSIFGFLRILSTEFTNNPKIPDFVLNNRIFLICLYITSIFAVLAAFAADFVGTGVGDNFKMRVFPYAMLFVVPVATVMLKDIFATLNSYQHKKIVSTIFIMLIVIFAIFSGLRATNDPLVSNHRIFYSIEEEYGMKWMEANLHGSFTSIEQRIYIAYNYILSFTSKKYLNLYKTPQSEYYFISKQLSLRDPNVQNDNTVYTNSDVQICGLRSINIEGT